MTRGNTVLVLGEGIELAQGTVAHIDPAKSGEHIASRRPGIASAKA